MKKTFVSAIAILFAVYVHAQQPQEPVKTDTKFPSADAYSHTQLTYKIINAPGKTWGYDIYADNSLMIHQSSAPALPGNQGFKTKADAEKVAQLVISKIKKPARLSRSGGGEMPPTVSVEELKKLKVIR